MVATSNEIAKKERKGFFARRFGAAKNQKTEPEVAMGHPPVLEPLPREEAVTSPGINDHFESSPTAQTADAQQRDSTQGDLPDQLDGMPLDDYCAAQNLSTADVWRRLRSGELTGRTEKGRLLIYGPGMNAFRIDGPLSFDALHSPLSGNQFIPPLPEEMGDLPPLPKEEAATQEASPQKAYLALSGDRSSSPELAMLLDHLSIAKEENREILRMTQEAIRKVSDMSDSLVEMKDAVIDAKELEIRLLREQLASQAAQVGKLKQQNEDLEMLTRTLMTNE